jgi:hypothetical protein
MPARNSHKSHLPYLKHNVAMIDNIKILAAVPVRAVAKIPRKTTMLPKNSMGIVHKCPLYSGPKGLLGSALRPANTSA